MPGKRCAWMASRGRSSRHPTSSDDRRKVSGPLRRAHGGCTQGRAAAQVGRPAPTGCGDRPARLSQRSEALRVSRQGGRQVWNIMPPQRRQGAGQGIGLWLVVVSPHVKQIHAVPRKPSSGPTISSGRPRRLISSRSFMSRMSGCPAGSCSNPSRLPRAARTGPDAAGFEGIGHNAHSPAQ
jgi:hypothetical protein